VSHQRTFFPAALVALSTLLSAGCPPCPPERKAGPVLVAEERRFVRSTADCDSGGPDCSSFLASYPSIACVTAPAVAESLNTIVRAFLLAGADGGLQEAAGRFLTTPGGTPGGGGRRLQRRVELLFDSLGIATLRLSTELSRSIGQTERSVHLRMVDTKKGRTLGIEDLFVPGYAPTLRRLGLAALRAAAADAAAPLPAPDQPGGTPLLAAVPRNAAVVPGGLLLAFTPGEAAPHAREGVTCVVPFDSLLLLIRRDGPLSPLSPWSVGTGSQAVMPPGS